MGYQLKAEIRHFNSELIFPLVINNEISIEINNSYYVIKKVINTDGPISLNAFLWLPLVFKIAYKQSICFTNFSIIQNVEKQGLFLDPNHFKEDMEVFSGHNSLLEGVKNGDIKTFKDKYIPSSFTKEIFNDIKTIMPKIFSELDTLNKGGFNRIANALKLYNNALKENDYIRFMLLIMAIESLFNCSSQELSFKLRVYMSFFLNKHLGLDINEIEKVIKSILSIRGKIAHGQKIDKIKSTSFLCLKSNWKQISTALIFN